jgi:hypothetical protein
MRSQGQTPLKQRRQKTKTSTTIVRQWRTITTYQKVVTKTTTTDRDECFEAGRGRLGVGFS